jgi:hypothetical protein
MSDQAMSYSLTTSCPELPILTCQMPILTLLLDCIQPGSWEHLATMLQSKPHIFSNTSLLSEIAVLAYSNRRHSFSHLLRKH